LDTQARDAAKTSIAVVSPRSERDSSDSDHSTRSDDLISLTRNTTNNKQQTTSLTMVGRYDSALEGTNDTPEGYGALEEDGPKAYTAPVPVPVPVPVTLETEPKSNQREGLFSSDDNSTSAGSGGLRDGLIVDTHTDNEESDEEAEDFDISLAELLYSSSSYYAIAKPVALTMILSALAVVYVNTDETRAEGEQAMATAYQMWSINNSGSDSNGQALALSLANALVMVSVICCMTFVIVSIYRFKYMKCLIGYMIFSSGTLLGVLGGNLLQVAIQIYNIPVDKLSFYFFIVNFCLVGVLSVFWGQGIPKYITQAYLIATSVILAWHLSYFDDWTVWCLLFMLAIYDLCAVLTPCGPLKALVELMSQEDAPDMPGLLFEADLPPEAKRPGIPRTATGLSQPSPSARSRSATPTPSAAVDPSGPLSPKSDLAAVSKDDGNSGIMDDRSRNVGEGPVVKVPLAIARVYNLTIVSVPAQSMRAMYPQRYADENVSALPLLQEEGGADDVSINLPEDPAPKQLRAVVTCRLPANGGRLEHVSRRGKKVYLERDRFGNPKRILWVDRNGKVFAEMRDDDPEGTERNSIRLGLGDFIFYSVLVAKAAEYSFATFAACTLVILAGLGGTLVLLSVYHHALPALPISIFLGVIFYLLTRFFVEPWIEAVLNQPYYV
jgi:presenilin 1